MDTNEAIEVGKAIGHDKPNNPLKDFFVIGALFAVLTILTMVTIIYAKEAEAEAREVRRELAELNVTAQNRCMVQVVLSYPPPITKDQYGVVLADFDRCISAQTGVN